jgi:site-specific DNA-methyltransferase (adenine-specific)
MAQLVRLVCPPGGLVLDPFNGSGSTGIAAVSEGCDYLGIELNPDYFTLALDRFAELWPEGPGWERQGNLALGRFSARP